MAASGPQAVPPPDAGPVLEVIRFSDDTEGSKDAGAASAEPADAGAAGTEPPEGAVLRIRLPGDTAVG